MVSTRRRFSRRALYCNALREPLLNVGCDGTHLASRRLDAQIRGALVQRPPHDHELLEHGPRVVPQQQGPRLRGFRAAHEGVDRGLEIDDDAGLGEPLAVGRVQDRAAACGQDDAVERREVGDDVALALAKRVSPSFSKMKRMSTPVRFSISASLSTNGRPSSVASRRPTAVLPEPIGPIR